MKSKLWLAGALTGAAVWLLLHLCVAADNDDRCRVARAFVDAYARRDLPAVREHLPTEPAHLFGPYPFTGLPKLSQPKVDGRQALIEFAGPVRQAPLPSRGGLLCYLEAGAWKVRQVLFYDQPPRTLRLPKRSKTADDRSQEPAVSSLGASFLAAWQRGDTRAVLGYWYDWPRRKDRVIRGLTARDIKVSITSAGGQEACAVYTATVTYRWGILSHSADIGGCLFLVREESVWKVRGNVMAFRF